MFSNLKEKHGLKTSAKIVLPFKLVSDIPETKKIGLFTRNKC